MLLNRVGILQQIQRNIFLIRTNAGHGIRKARTSNHGQILRYEFLFVPHSRIILGRVIKSVLHEVGTDILKTLPPFLYLLISPKYLHPARRVARLIQFKLPISSSKGTKW